MTDFIILLNKFTPIITLCLNTFGVVIGQSKIAKQATKAINIQPKAQIEINRVAILTSAVTETAAVLGLAIAFIITTTNTNNTENLFYTSLARIGIIFAIGIPGFLIGILSSLPGGQACLSIARQPFSVTKIQGIALLTMTVIQTPIIFGFIIGAVFIYPQSSNITNIHESLRLFASGLCIGLGSIGPAIGLAKFAQIVCISIGKNIKAYNGIFSFAFFSLAMIETPIIFAILISLILVSTPILIHSNSIAAGISFLSAAICVGVSTFVPGLSSGKIASSACKQITLKPQIYTVLSKTSMLYQGLLDTFAIYGLIIAWLLILSAK